MIILGVEEQVGRPIKTSPDPSEAYVIFDGRSRAIVLKTGERLSPAEIKHWGRRKVVRVSTAEHSTKVDAKVIAKDGFRHFQFNLSVIWKIKDFEKAARGESPDLDSAIRAVVDANAGELDRRYEMTDEGANALYQNLKHSLVLTDIEFVRVVRMSGRVSFDAFQVGHLTEVQGLRNQAELGSAKSALQIADENTRIQLEEMRLKLALETARQRSVLELDLIKTKMEYFQKVSGVDSGLVSLQLANDPTQVDVVIQRARDHELVHARLRLEALKTLSEGVLEADGVEGFHLQNVAKQTFDQLLLLATGELDASKGIEGRGLPASTQAIGPAGQKPAPQDDPASGQ